MADAAKRGQHVCVDVLAEGAGSTGDENGPQLAVVKAVSGLAGLANYRGGTEITCAVCGSSNTGAVYTR